MFNTGNAKAHQINTVVRSSNHLSFLEPTTLIYLLFRLRSGHFPRTFPTRILYWYLFSPKWPTCSIHCKYPNNTNKFLQYFVYLCCQSYYCCWVMLLPAAAVWTWTLVARSLSPSPTLSLQPAACPHCLWREMMAIQGRQALGGEPGSQLLAALAGMSSRVLGDAWWWHRALQREGGGTRAEVRSSRRDPASSLQHVELQQHGSNANFWENLGTVKLYWMVWNISHNALTLQAPAYITVLELRKM
jgi:hypothetical protein